VTGRLVKLLVGLWVFGTGEAAIVAADLGNSPWTVFAQGVANHTPLTIGSATVISSFVVLLMWIPLRQRPGIGTIANAILIGVAIDAMLPLWPDTDAVPARAAMLAAGVALVSLGSGLYLTARLGPGPRDGLMTGLARRTGRSLRLWRTVIEVSALAIGWALGGVVGIGTVVFAVLIGPGVQFAVHRIDPEPL
jgi:uncharacterized protein